MNVYKVWRDDHDVDYDETAGMVVLAETPKQAREIVAAEKRGDEFKPIWLDPKQSRVQKVNVYGRKPGIVLVDYHAG